MRCGFFQFLSFAAINLTKYHSIDHLLFDVHTAQKIKQQDELIPLFSYEQVKKHESESPSGIQEGNRNDLCPPPPPQYIHKMRKLTRGRVPTARDAASHRIGWGYLAKPLWNRLDQSCSRKRCERSLYFRRMTPCGFTP